MEAFQIFGELESCKQFTFGLNKTFCSTIFNLFFRVFHVFNFRINKLRNIVKNVNEFLFFRIFKHFAEIYANLWQISVDLDLQFSAKKKVSAKNLHAALIRITIWWIEGRAGWY